MTVLFLLALCSFICGVLCAANKCPAWVPIVLLALYCLIQQLPVGK